MLGGYFAQGQTITNVVVSGTPVCPGSYINVTSYLDSSVFDANTVYTIRLGLLSDCGTTSCTFTTFATQIFSGTSPSYSNPGKTYYIQHQFTVPRSIESRTDFRIWVSSTNPTAGGTTAAVSDIFGVKPIPASPVASNNGVLCIGGTINLSATTVSGATYSWTGPNNYTSTAQNPSRSSATAAMAGVYTVVATVNGCASNPASTTVTGSVAADSQTTAGTNSWVGHVYDGTGFSTYAGNYTETESFDQSFGGNTSCFGISANSAPISIYTETFSVRYRMKSSRKGLYVVDLGSDDGSRLSVDGNLVYNNWVDQAYSTRPGILMSLNGNSNLLYEFYENAGGNRVSFGNIKLVLENKLIGNIEQQLCSGGAAMEISGDVYGALPSGIATSGTGYQWSYSATPGGAKTDIAGATAANFTPNITTAPFSNGGKYYIFRKAVLVSSNNTGYTSYIATNISNPAILNIDKPITNNTISRGETGSICGTADENSNLTLTAPPGTVFLSVEFASYGTPAGACGSFSLSTCHSATSKSVVEGYLLGINSATIPATNAVFGDPCSGTFKRLYVQATYGPPELCSGDAPSNIIGSTPAGAVNPVYLWETSITGLDNGFSAGPGTNSTKDYSPGPLTQTTWLRRQVTNSCGTDISNVIQVKVNVPTAELSGSMDICAGQSFDLTATFTGKGPWDFTLDSGGISSSYMGVQSPYIISVNPSETTSYKITSITDAGGCASATQSNIVTVTVKGALWTGNTSNDWYTPSNWECNSIPTLNTHVVINSGLTNYPILNTGPIGKAKDIQIQTGATLTILDNTLQIAGSVVNSGTFDALNGSVAFVGTSAQTIPANTFSSNRIRNLIINNTAGVSSSGNLEITGFLRVENGNFNTGNKLALLSNATQTALIDGSGNGQVVGTVKMQRYLDVAFGYKYFSSPFSNSTVGDFSSYVDLTATFPNFYTYDENREYDADSASTGWKPYTTVTDPLGILKGYALNFGNTLASPKTVEISGTVNNGNQQIALANNNRTYTKGFNLVGNPYPSPIDWDAATGWTKTYIDDAIYFFTAGSTNMYTGTYTSYVNGVQSTDGLSSNIIPSMQGFFVHVTDTGIYPVSGTLGMTNEVRVTNFSQEFLKVREPEKAPLIRITAAFEDEVKTDPTVIYFPNFAELSFEKDKDALKLINTDITVPNLYSLTPENKKLSINALPKPRSEDVKKIPLGLKTEKNGWMSIVLKDLENLPSNFNVYLIDSEKRIGQNLSRKPRYRFYAKSGRHDSRFHLMFSETEISDPAIAFDEPFSVKTVGGKVMVSMNLETGQKAVLLASTVTGQILDRKNVSGKESIEIVGIKSSGVYFFSINLKDGMFSKKVLIQK